MKLPGKKGSQAENTPLNLSGSSPLQVSFEFFPPATEAATKKLWTTLERLAPLDPSFVSVTYGAGGSTRQTTHDVVARIRQETDLEPAAHLTCVGASKAEIEEVAHAYWEAGVRHIVALRGDPPQGETEFKPHPDGFSGSVELIEFLKKLHDFEITVGCYPEIHPNAHSSQSDLDYLKRKMDAGATRAITQFFFDPETYLNFVERAASNGVDIPIVPGILPITSYSRIKSFSAQCGTQVPAWLTHLFEGLEDDPATRDYNAAIVASELCRRLQYEGVKNFHFYTLNRADLVYGVCHSIGVRPKSSIIE
ncbi:methylenetetrahydrofolate reductase [NAD(P)H] [Sneathiella sp. P13V-1]|uniref:methylenetetrahydrofolate reductase [NAD(P)H] n=1 Tax=Sneathiella sp. P13V-1 TaxID=2697366 RepID=UPI00187B1F65|nr:methylenetetrahydrofolate reductase [NAD(P)H] [Sneathiella sp. P13V-1]MBE7637223.1 methylenetetrahydrofolate reductase [NAD(P)H] [Sneathiella sp. P13V-1]